MMKYAKYVYLAVAAVLLLSACELDKPRQHIKDPAHQRFVDFLNAVKNNKFDDAYNMLTEETKKAYPKELFIKFAKEKLQRFGDYYVVTKIQKDVANAHATFTTKLVGKYEKWNSMPSAKFEPVMVYKNGQWYFEIPERIAILKQWEDAEKRRQERVAKYKDKIVITNWKVKNEIVDNQPQIAFSGDIENKSNDELDIVRLRVWFLGPNGKPVPICSIKGDPESCKDFLDVVPIYVDPENEKVSLKPGEKRHFVETIISELPLKWTGKTKVEVYDAGTQAEFSEWSAAWRAHVDLFENEDWKY